MSNDKPQQPGESDLLRQLLADRNMKEGQTGAYVAILNQLEWNRQMIHSNEWHKAQVDAQLRAKYRACGMEDVYQPPGECEEGEEVTHGPTLINCNFQGDTAVSKIAQAITDIERPDPDPDPDPKPPEPQPPEPEPPEEKPWWVRFLAAWMLLCAVILGSLLIWITLQFFGGDPTTGGTYEIVAVPYEPPTERMP